MRILNTIENLFVSGGIPPFIIYDSETGNLHVGAGCFGKAQTIPPEHQAYNLYYDLYLQQMKNIFEI